MQPVRSLLLGACLGIGIINSASAAPSFRAGAFAVEISPTNFPVRVNAMFTERSADNVVDPLFAKALALNDGSIRLVLCVVDTCMMPRDLIDRAKSAASESTGIPTDHMLVSSTHTHSAPSAMGCLGSRVDPRYAAFLPSRITAAIVGSVERLAPARVGWAQSDDWEHTFNRRWVRRPDRVFADPFGETNVRAHMHPGHESPDAIGPSGPVDPQLSVLALQSVDGKPLALLANYSMHYYESAMLSSDYYGRFAEHVATMLGADESFVGIMSQGTSGDLMWMDYGAPRNQIGYDAYAKEIAERVNGMVQRMKWHDSAPLKMAESTLELGYRVPDETRLDWARAMSAKLGEKLPRSQPEIYALESIFLHERPRTELVMQALRIGELGIAALPNEVFAITGLKLKQQSPLAAMFNIELANGAEGYIPPPEQHKLGGYTTWAARTAGLEVGAEPRIVETALALLEEVAGTARRNPPVEDGAYARAVMDANPEVYWRLEDMVIPTAHDTLERHDADIEAGVALFLPGADGRRGHQPPEPPTPNAFSGAGINRSAHFAGGRLRADVPLGENYSVELWLWNGLPADARAVAGYVFSRGPDGDPSARGEHLGIGGTYRADLTGKLIVFNGNDANEVLTGRTQLALRAWHHVVLVREGNQVRVHLDGRKDPEISATFRHTVPVGENTIFVGGRSDGLFNLEGKLDEVALYNRALGADEISAHYHASGLTSPVAVVSKPAIDPPLSPAESLKKIHVREGYRAELVATEPLVMDPVAIDWSADGRLWVVEMADYPLGMDGRGQIGGRVRVLEDTDDDGLYDRQNLFADGLSFPTGVLAWRDGLIVTAAPEVLYLRDTNGDGRADAREVLISGLSTGNQQLRVNGLRWGLDGWVYCAAGAHYRGYGADTQLHTRAGNFSVGSRDFRFRPDTGELEPASGPSQYGRNRDDWGHWFGTQNSRPLWHYVLADRYLQRNPFVAAPDPTHQVVVPLNPKVWPVSAQQKRFHSFDNAGHFTSACAGMIYRDDLLFPLEPDQMHAFTCEPFHNLVQRNVITDDGVTYAAHRAPGEEQSDFFASEDRWCRPVMTRTGPDGALWVVDMYRYMIEHPEWLPANGRAELLPGYRLGDDRGRIYRVFPENQAPRKPVRLDQLKNRQLVAALDSSNAWQRDRAHMLLTWRADPSVVAPLEQLALNGTNPAVRVQALCALDTTNLLRPAVVVRALRDPHPGVRENALRLAETRGTTKVINAAVKLVEDPDARVRLQLVFSLGAWTNQLAGEALGQLAVAEFAEPFTLAAVLSSAVPHLRALATTVTQDARAMNALGEPLSNTALGLNDRNALAKLLAPTLTPDQRGYTEAQFTAATRFLDTLSSHGTSLVTLSTGDDALAALLTASAGDGAGSILVAAHRTLINETRAEPDRAAAAGLVARDAARRGDALKELKDLLTPRTPGDLQRVAIQALAATGDAIVPQSLLAAWISFSPQTRTTALDALLSREQWAFALLGRIGAGDAIALDVAQRARLLKHRSKRVRETAAAVFKSNGNRAKVIEQFQPALQLTGNALHGRVIFTRACITCHKDGETGGEVGPNLKSVANHPPEKLLANILDPSADVQPGYHAYQCELTDGSELYGLIASETGNSLTIRTADGRSHAVLRASIESLSSANISLMPDGLEAGLTPQDMADLIKFVRTIGAAQ